ncbi:hypothetical protein [Actinoallomurus sp. NPDC052274]|uniref:hypothetical protein n=1 Tax=Actinoallomurus sp. NPDC052274 TaxID=3155420 RepID=UPI00341248FE
MDGGNSARTGSLSPLAVRLLLTGLALVGAAIAVMALNVPWFLGDSSTSAGRQANTEHLPSPQLHAVPGDDKDPLDTGCDKDSKDVGHADIIDRPGRLVIGQAIARYSLACKAVWARFEPTKALDRIAPYASVILIAQHAGGLGRLFFTEPYPGTFMWGNMLLTSGGCVTVTVAVSDPSIKPVAAASTPCVTG